MNIKPSFNEAARTRAVSPTADFNYSARNESAPAGGAPSIIGRWFGQQSSYARPYGYSEPQA